MQKNIFLTLLFFVCCLISLKVEAQRFKAGLIVGMNAAQIDGDATAGYNKIGIRGGLRSTILLQDKMDIGIDILYSQRGSQSGLIAGNVVDQLKINLQYIEVPITFNYSDWYQEEDDFYRVQFTGGLSYGRLFNYNFDGSGLESLTDFLSKDDISLTFGVSYFINESLAFSFRYNRSLTYLFNPEKDEDAPNADPLLEKFLSFYAQYLF